MPTIPKLLLRVAAALGAIGLLLRTLYRQPSRIASDFQKSVLPDFADTEPAIRGGQ